MPRSAMKRAHSAWITLEKVQEPISVSCFLIMSRLTSMVTLPRSPTKQAVPQVRVARIAAARPPRRRSSRAPCRARPWVSSRIASTGSSARIDHRSAPMLAREVAPLGRDVERDHARAHGRGELRRRQAHRALAEDGDRVAALQTSCGAAPPRRCRCRRRSRRRSRRRARRAAAPASRRHLHVFGMGAVRGDAVDHEALEAHLRPAGRQCWQTPQPR